jgi:uncharacterized repeat protein (TIGR03803 family)
MVRPFPLFLAAAALAAGCNASLPPPALLPAGAAVPNQVRAHVTEKVLYAFTGAGDGGGPNGAIVFDGSGNIFGTTHFGGITTCGGIVGGGCGVVFELSPASGGWKESALYAFGDTSDGGFPNAGVILDKNGNVFGTASTGGSFQCSIGCGVIYELLKSGNWSESVLHTFTGSDGQFPNAVLLQGNNGALYSTTWYGGSTGNGTVFALTPSGSSWNENVLYSFQGTTDGSAPAAGVIADGAGNLYGTTYKFDGSNDGVAYELKKRAGWKDQILATFGTSGDGGENPYAGLLMPAKGKLFGTTIEGGSNGTGVAFELVHTNKQWTERVLHVFGNPGDGSTPYGGLIAGHSGNLYGTTLFGGSYNAGTVYELKQSRGGVWKERILYSFTGGADGGDPGGTLTADSSGNLYGVAGGGQTGNGVIFEISGV